MAALREVLAFGVATLLIVGCGGPNSALGLTAMSAGALIGTNAATMAVQKLMNHEEEERRARLEEALIRKMEREAPDDDDYDAGEDDGYRYRPRREYGPGRSCPPGMCY